MTAHFQVPKTSDLRQSVSGATLARALGALEKAATQRPVKQKRVDAELAFDGLERRYLLSADISPYLDTLDDGLDRLELLFDDLEAFGEMASVIPVLGQSLGELANLAETLRSELTDPIQNALSGGLVQEVDELTTVIDELGSAPGDVTVTSTSNGDEISWDVSFSTTLSIGDLLPDFGATFEGLGLEFSEAIGADVTVSFDFGFGVLTDPVISPTDAGFIDADSMLSVDVDGTFGSLAELRVGLLGGASAAATATVEAGLNVTLDGNPGQSADGKLTIAEIDASGATLLNTAIDAGETAFDVSFEVDATGVSGIGGLAGITELEAVGITLALVDSAGNPIDLGTNPEALFENPSISVDIDAPELADFTRINSGTLLTFMATLGDKIQTISTAFQDLAQFDFFDVSFDKLADYAAAFEALTSALSVPGLIGTTDIDLPDATGSFMLGYTLAGEGGANPVSGTTAQINVDFTGLDLEGARAALESAINGALDVAIAGPNPNIAVVIEQGRMVLRSVVENADTTFFFDFALQGVNSVLTDAIGWQEDQTSLRLPVFDTIQEFAEELSNVPAVATALNDIGLAYAGGALTFSLDILNEVVNQSISFDFSEGLTLFEEAPFGLGEVSLTGSATAFLDAGVALSFGGGIDLSALADATDLADLNGGVGVGFSSTSAPDLIFALSDGSSHSIRFTDVGVTASSTVGDLVAAINALAPSDFEIRIDALGNGFELIDKTGGDGVFAVAGGSTSQAIYDLGFGFGSAAEAGQTTLYGAAVIERFFVRDDVTNVGASVSITAEDIELYGSLGFLTFGIQGGQLGGTLANNPDLYGDRAGDTLEDLAFSLELALDDPIDQGDHRIYLNELSLARSETPPAFDLTGLPEADRTLEFELGDGSTTTVVIAETATLAQALDTIASQTGGNVEAFLNPAGTAIIFVDKTLEIGELTLIGTPSNGDTVTVGDTVLTFGSGGVAIGGSAETAATNLAAAIDAIEGYSASAAGDTVTLSHTALVAGSVPNDPDIDTSFGDDWTTSTFTALDGGTDPDSAAQQLGIGIGFVDTEDRDGDGVILGAALGEADFEAIGAYGFDGGITGELVLPVVFNGTEALGLELDTILLSVGFVQGSILTQFDFSGDNAALENFLTAIESLGSQDLFAVIGEIASVMNDQIDVLNADLPMLGNSISDIIGGVSDQFGGVIDAINQDLATTLQTQVGIFRTAFETLVGDLPTDFAQEFLDSDEGRTIAAAIGDMQTVASNLATEGFDILFDDVPGKLLSSVAAIRGTIAKITDTARTTLNTAAAGYAELVSEVTSTAANTIGNTIDTIGDLTPDTETVLRLLQEALGFELPSLDDAMGDVLPAEIASKINDFLQETVDNSIDFTQETIEDVIGFIGEATEAIRDTAVTTIEDFIINAESSIGDAAVDAYLEQLATVLNALTYPAGALLGDAPIDASALDNTEQTISIAVDGAPAVELTIDTDGMTTDAEVVSAINAQIAADPDLNGKVQAEIDDNGKFVLQTIGDATEAAITAVGSVLSDVLNVVGGAAETLLYTIEGVIETLQNLDGETIFALIKELPYISDAVQAIDALIRTLTDTDGTTLLTELLDYADNNVDLDIADVEAMLAGLRDLVDGVVDEIRGTVLGLFGGGVLNFDMDTETGLVDIGLFYAPSIFSVDESAIDFEFSVGGEAFGFGAGVSDGGMALDIGGYIDLGFVIALPDSFELFTGDAGGYGSDFELYLLPDSAIGLSVDFEVSGQLQVQLGAVGVIFGAQTLGDPFLTLTDLSGYAPAFIQVGVGGTTTEVAGRDLLALGDASLTATAEARLKGDLYAYNLSESAIEWNPGGGDEQVALNFDIEVSWVGGEFDFDFQANTLETGEIDAILASLLTFDLSLIIDAFQMFLGAFGDFLDLLGEAPIIGDELDVVSDAYDDLEEVLVDITDQLKTITDTDNVVSFVQDAIFDLFGAITVADGVVLGLLDANGDALTDATQIDVVYTGVDISDFGGAANPALLIQPMRIGFTVDEEAEFDFGLDALVLEVATEGNVEVALDLVLTVGFGLSLQDGAFLILPDEDNDTLDDGVADPVFAGTFDVGLTDASLGLGLFFIGLEATTWEALPDGFDTSNVPASANLAQGVGFHAEILVDLTDGGGGLPGSSETFDGTQAQIVKLTEIGDLEVETDVSAEVNIDLLLRAGVSFDVDAGIVDDNLPSLSTYLNIDWAWSLNDEVGNGALGVQFYDLSLDMGEWVQNALGGVLDSIQRFTAPLQPFLDFLNIEIPIISQLSSLFGQDPVTFLDAIGFLGSGIETVEKFLEVLDTINTVLDFVDTFASGSFINFGDFIISENPGLDLRDLASREVLSGDGLFNPANFAGGGINAPSEENLRDEISSEGGGIFDEIFDSLHEIGLFLPFLEDPAQLFGLLFGQRIDFVIWDIPRLEAEFGVSYRFGPILPPVPLFVTIGGGFEIFLDIYVGYDSRGLETGDFIDGFYFGDWVIEDDGTIVQEDALELGLSVFFEATASLSVLVAEAGVTGGVEAVIGANWADQDGDGKFYLDEVLQRASMGIFCIFDLEGALEAYLEAFVKLGFDTPFGFVTLFSDTFELLRVTLLDFTVSCPPLPTPELGGQDDEGAVILNIGTRAGDRQPGADGNDDEQLMIFGDRIGDDPNETVSLWKDGITGAAIDAYFADGVLTREEIEGNLGDFNADLDLNRDGNIDTDEILAALDLDGNKDSYDAGYGLVVGFGEWEIYRGVTKMVGDAAGGDDEIIADCESVSFALEIYGGSGEDTLEGGMGNDTLIGGADADIVRGCTGNDILLGDGTAAIAGNATDGWYLNITNFVTGNGEDAVYGGGGHDLIYGGGGNDTLRGDGDDDNPETSTDGNDTIFGNDGEDQIDGFLGNDMLLGGRGADNISGDQGNDIIRGDFEGVTFSKTPDLGSITTANRNTNVGEIDLITGGAGNDFIGGDGGNDIIYGEDTDITGDETGNFNDTIHGDGGDDEIRGQLGDDVIYGGDDVDRLIGGAGNDKIYGNGARDTIYGDRLAEDGLPAVDGNDTIEGGAAGDVIYGQGGIDWIIGGIDVNSVTGDNAVYAYGGASDGGDLIYAGAGNDIVLGDDGFITNGEDYATQTDGTGGNDEIYAGSGDDQVAGGRGADTIYGDNAGGTGEDILVGDEVVRDGTSILATVNQPHDGNDKIYGYGGSDIGIGGGGMDTVFGAGGDDIIAGDYAVLSFKDSGGSSLFDMVAWIRTIDPGEGAADRLIGDAGSDIVLGGDAGDLVFGGSISDGSNILLGDHGLVVRDDGSEFENDVFSLYGDIGGNDVILGGGQVDIAIGGTGDDTILTLGGEDVVLGDAGFVLRDAEADPVRVSSSFIDFNIASIGAIPAGFASLDFGLAAVNPDVLATGKDYIDTGEGNDVALGGLDADLIFGRDGNDVLLGDNGEVLYNGAGAGLSFVTTVRTIGVDGGIDAIFGEAGADVGFGGAVGDYLYGDDGASPTRNGDDFTIGALTASTAPGDDVMVGDYGELSLVGGFPTLLTSTDEAFGGNDLIDLNEGADVGIGSQGADLIFGRDGDDVLLGDNGVITYYGGGNGVVFIQQIKTLGTEGGIDAIFGEAGSDIGFAGAVGDYLYGDDGASPTRNGNDFTIGALTPSGSPGPDVMVGDFGRLELTAGNPTYLTSTDMAVGGNDLIDLNEGADVGVGSQGADLIFGRADDDVLLGDNGEITYFGGGNGVAFIDLIETLGIEGGIDAIFGEGGTDVAFGGALGDYIFGDLTAVIVRDGDDFDVAGASFDSVPGAASDVLAGDFGVLDLNIGGVYDTLYSTDHASGGNDLIEGHEGDDIALGGQGNDTIHGEAPTARYGLLTAVVGHDILLGDSGELVFDTGTLSQSDFLLVQTTAPGIGGSDVILGNDGSDMIMGGMAGDFLYGDRVANVSGFDLEDIILTTAELPGDPILTETGEDTIIGDNGKADFLPVSDTVENRNEAVFAVPVLLPNTTLITTTNKNDGGQDLILGDGKGDLIFGGTDKDRIWGDEGAPDDTGNPAEDGDDLIFGDHGKVWQQAGKGGALDVGDDYFAIDTGELDGGDDDVIFAEGGEDTVLGQQGDDVIFGGLGDDNLIGGHNTEGGADELDPLLPIQQLAINPTDLADLNPTDLPNVNDIIDAGAGEDIVAGDNAYFYQWGGQVTDDASFSLRFRELLTDPETGLELDLYRMIQQDIEIGTPGTFSTEFLVDLGFAPNVAEEALALLVQAQKRNIFLLDFDAETQSDALVDANAARPFGDDVITGNTENDEIYGGLGDDVIQGDGMIELVAADAEDSFGVLGGQHSFVVTEGGLNFTVAPDPNSTVTHGLRFAVGSSAADGDDYIEGNGGNDRMYGNLGQDDLIGGNSSLVAVELNSDLTGAGLRPDGADMIYGGSADAGWLARNADHTEAGDALVGSDNFHTADADVILGDNGNIYRLMSEFGDPRSFNYAVGEGYGTDATDSNLDDGLKIRLVELLDYAYSIADEGVDTVDWKTTFLDYGVGAGDLIHGESGDDIVHGMTGDDVIFGEAGDDDLYGEAGADVILGGRGVDGIMGDDGLLSTSRNGLLEPLIGLDEANLQDIIRTPGNLQIALIYRTGDLLKTGTMIAFDLDGVDFGTNWQARQVTSANDIIFGGWENDFIHTGFGDDAVSGAEALPLYYEADGTNFTAVNALLADLHNLDPVADPVADVPFWQSFALVNPGDVLAFGAFDEEEFALYDENAPRERIFVSGGGLVDVDWLLNNDAADGLRDMTFSYYDNSPQAPELYTDGADHLFGDLGNDWIVGGTGRDQMYGGRGSDLIQMDDDIKLGADAKKPDPYQEYADIAYDGAGRDYLILNTGADRAIGWVGEYNSYIVPFSPFGAFHIARLLQPHTEQFVLDLARASGADESTPDILRFAEQFSVDDKLDNPLDPDIYDERHGSPFNELGMVRQEDFDWGDQSGPPDDPQAGNTQGPRKIMRREIWDENDGGALQAQLDQLEADEWYLVEQAFAEEWGDVNKLELIGRIKLDAETEILGGIGTDESEFSFVTLTAKVEVDKPGKKDDAGAYLLFDVIDDQNFKFVGFDVNDNRVYAGVVVNGNWNVTDNARERLKATAEYNLEVTLRGSTVELRIDGQLLLTADLGDDLTDGEYGIAASGVQVNFQDFVVLGTEKMLVSSEEIATIDVEATTMSLASTTTSSEITTVDWSGTTVADTGSGTTTDGGTSTSGGSETLSFESTETIALDYGTGETMTSSDTTTTEEEQVVVEAWAPRDDFAA